MVGLMFGFLEGKQKRKEGTGQSSKRETYLGEHYNHFDFVPYYCLQSGVFKKLFGECISRVQTRQSSTESVAFIYIYTHT